MSCARFFNTKKGNAAPIAAMPVPASRTAAGLVPAPANKKNNNTIAALKTTAASKVKGWNVANAAAFAATTDAVRVRARAFKLVLLACKGRGVDAAPANVAASVALLPLPAAAETVVPAPVAEHSLVETAATSDDNTGDDGAGITAPTTTTAAKVRNWHAAAKAALAAKASLVRSRAVAMLSRNKDRATPLLAIEVEACVADGSDDNDNGSDDNASEGAPQPAVASADAGRRATMRARMISAWAALASRAAVPKAPQAPLKKRALLPSVQAVRGYFSSCVAPGKKAVAVVA
jgi:hypothetical protein